MFKRIKTQALVNNPWVLFGIALIAAALLTWWIYQFLSGREAAMRESMLQSMNAQKQVSVVVPRTDLKAGAVINSDQFAARDVPTDFVYDDTIRASEFDSLANLTIVRPVARGTPLRRADISAMQARDFSDMLTAGHRALTIDIDTTNSADNMLKPGNHIDLFLIANQPSDKSTSNDNDSSSQGQTAHLLLSDLSVLATGQDVRPRDYGEAMSQQDGDGSQQRGGYDSLTLQVTPEQAGKIALAQKVGSLRAVLRNRADTLKTPDVTVMEASLFDENAANGGVQYIVGGSKNAEVSMRPDLGAAIHAVAVNTPAAKTAQPQTAALSDDQTRALAQISNAMAGHHAQ